MQQVDNNFSDISNEISQLLDSSEQSRNSSVQSAVESGQMEETWRQSAIQEHYHTIISTAPLILFTTDCNGIITLSEGKGLELFGRKAGESVGQSLFDLYRDVPQILDSARRALAGETLTALAPIGNRTFETCYAPLRDADNQVTGLVGVALDITERVRAEQALQARERYFRALTEQASDLVMILDATGIYRYASPSHKHILGYAPEKLLGTSAFDFIHPDDLPQTLADFTSALQYSSTAARTECRARHANGSWVYLECVGHNCLHDPDIAGLIINARDITERKAMEEVLRHSALYDSLTGLPNRTLLQEQLAQTLQMTTDYNSETALLIMDIDRFKDINDTFGFQYGDQLLQEVAMRLRQALPVSYIIAHLYGDEFAILLQIANEDSVQHAADTIHTALEEPFTLADCPLQITASIGVALYPLHGTDPVTLLRHADIAMYTAKRAHEGYALYDLTHNEQDSSHRLTLVAALRHAIHHDELTLYYQPKVNLKTGQSNSVEALARWQHPTYGFIPPNQFIALAEQTGLIAPLTHWVLKTAIRQCSQWLCAGIELSVAVNLSAYDLREITLPNKIAALLREYDVPPRLLRIELTESTIMTDTDRSLDVLTRLARLGIPISIDDFGTGYSSLAYLKRLPVDELKIDRSFVQHMTHVETDATIVHSTVTLAHNLGLQVVAEGVEDVDTFHLLARLSCDTAQGYYMSRPLPAQDTERWIRHTQQSIVSQNGL